MATSLHPLQGTSWTSINRISPFTFIALVFQLNICLIKCVKSVPSSQSQQANPSIYDEGIYKLVGIRLNVTLFNLTRTTLLLTLPPPDFLIENVSTFFDLKLDNSFLKELMLSQAMLQNVSKVCLLDIQEGGL